jgi:hypothetical protein
MTLWRCDAMTGTARVFEDATPTLPATRSA